MDFTILVNSLGLIGLAIVNFLSSSILPIPSEPAILVATNFYSLELVFIFTMIGAMLGSILNYYIGYTGIRKLFFNLFDRNKKQERAAKAWIEKYGLWSLFLVQWIPIIGDPLMIAIGAVKVDFRKFLIFLFFAEALKAVIVIYLGTILFSLI
jgi:membrane protein YqaA with SNARE-associated domain